MIPLLEYQNLSHHVDGSATAPAPTVLIGDKPADNPAFSAWKIADQKTVITLHASLSEEATIPIIGLTTAREIWLALEATFRNNSVDRIHNLRDQLRSAVKGDKSVAEFGLCIKLIKEMIKSRL